MKHLIPVLCTILFIWTVLTVGTLSSTAETAEVYLSDLKATTAKVGWGELHLNEGLDGNPLLIADVTYQKGICAHAASELTYDVSSGEYKRFVAEIGVHNGTNNGTKDASSVRFFVRADDKQIYESDVYRIDTPAGHIDLEIPVGTKTLTLITTDANDGNSGDHSAWADARFILGDIDLTALQGMEVTAEKTELTVGESEKLAVKLTNYGGSEIALSKAKVKYISTDPAAIAVDANGTVTCKGAGSAAVTVTATVGKATMEKTVTLRGRTATEPSFGETLSSPDGSVKVDVSMDCFGAIRFTASESGETVLPDATVGTDTTGCGFFDGFTFLRKETGSIDESYTNKSGKRSTGRDHANFLILTFSKSEYLFTVEFRAYDDGFAYRYTISRKDKKAEALTVTRESGSFTLQSDSTVTAIMIGSIGASFNHEAGYTDRKVSGIKSGYFAFPVLNTLKSGKYMLLSEAELYGDSYVGSVLHGESDGSLQLTFAPKASKGTTVDIRTDFTSPWRFGITGNGLGDIVESDLTENLHARSTGDYSWVEPGVTAWMWLSEGFGGQRNKETVYRYIDLASEMGWKYLILDEGWQPNSTSNNGRRYEGYFNWFDDMIAYADEKGVGIIAWVLCNDLDTPKEREILQEWADKGIKGIKVDFFDSEDSDHITYYKEIYEACAKAKLIVNCHGANKPTGERQYWPNIINREAVNGEEYGGFGAATLTVWPYIRNVVGPMDLTPRMNPSTGSETTVGAQMAMNVVFECGIPCMGSAADEYLASGAKSFYQNLPAAWDDIHFIDGGVGKYSIIARRSGDDWYVGGVFNVRKQIDFTLDFLGDGDYMAFVYSDGEGKYDLQTSTALVKKGDKLALPYAMRVGSGFAVKLIKVSTANTPANFAPVTADLTVETAATVTPEYKGENLCGGFYLRFTSSDESVVTVNENGVITGIKPGKATVTASFTGDPAVKAVWNVTVTAGAIRRNPVWSIDRETLVYGGTLDPEKPNTLKLQTVTGDITGAYTNIWNTALPAGDFEVTVATYARFDREDETAGLVLYSAADPDRTVALARRYFQSGSCVDLYSFDGSLNHNKKLCKGNGFVYLKLTRSENTLKGSYSTDGKQWTNIGNILLKKLASATDLRIGVYCSSGTTGAFEPATFSNFTLNKKVIPFAVAGDYVDPAEDEPKDEPKDEPQENTSGETGSGCSSGTTKPEEKPDNVLLPVILSVVGAAVIAGVVILLIKRKKKQ